ncbi:hypothetical protein N1028_13305 [Herbiconiux sp. CPCC 203407]|uniref:Uncharacterized protein n=1 Tax=Herbiconiux oxytropis TaxID=2970915 RepID=A0AA41XES4_9MICO|nr:hypothetical protein [Herbiconiux oxytropis]MCS5723060.1 hypothetical protein [Herbiconiux oxytropis]MCS5726871.1 hypothetical protein [Herbiconiux oxytropis]
MDEARRYAHSRLASGLAPRVVVSELVSAGWPPAAAWTVVSSVTPPPAPVQPPLDQPAGWLPVGSIVVGGAFLLATALMAVAVFRSPDGPRAHLARLTDGQLPIGLYLAVTVALWLVGLGLLIAHHVRSRRARLATGRRRRVSTAVVFAWILTVGNPILAALLGVFGVVFAVALGVMCGEAVSENCGMGG